ncbi:MAG: hypothetical protein SWC40_10280 [Thermodesulfobacteriota bacterium]|nr:hypothetical protein [Thermodesulfobacteriota bacterium]
MLAVSLRRLAETSLLWGPSEGLTGSGWSAALHSWSQQTVHEDVGRVEYRETPGSRSIGGSIRCKAIDDVR